MQSIQDLRSTLTLAISFRGRGDNSKFPYPSLHLMKSNGLHICDSQIVVALERLRIVNLYEGASTT